MAVISFSSDDSKRIWGVAGWAFRQLLADVLMAYPNDAVIAAELEEAELLKCLSVDSLPPDRASVITHAIRSTVVGILNGTLPSGIISQRYGDARTVAQYKSALVELLALADDGAQ